MPSLRSTVTSSEFDGRLARVERALWVDRGIIGKLEAVSALATRLVDGCDRAGMAMDVHGRVQSLAVTDDVVLEVDLVQYDTGEGPCLYAIEHSHIVRLDVLEPDERWKHFAPGALAHGVHSVLSLPIAARGVTIGALNLYSESRDVVRPEVEPLASALAAYAGEVISTSPLYAYSLDLLDEVLDELASRGLVDTAIGIIVSRTGKSPDDALEVLAADAARRGESVRAAAEWELREQQLRRHSEPSPDEGKA
jgi:GAF domain-containing protein